MKLHPASLAVGAALAIGVALLSAQQIVGSPAIVVRRVIEPVVTHEGAHPRDWVRVVEGTPYTVPPGRILAVTGTRHLGAFRGGALSGDHQLTVNVDFNGSLVVVAHSRWSYQSNNGQSGGNGDLDIPPGLAASEGTVVTVTNGILLGYLVDA